MAGLNSIHLENLTQEIGRPPPKALRKKLRDLASTGYLQKDGDVVTLTQRGVLLSNEVFRELTP